MKPETKKKLKAWGCLAGTYFLTMVVAVGVYWLAIYIPFLKDSGMAPVWRVLTPLAWLFFCNHLYNRQVERRTHWLEIINGNYAQGKKGEKG